MNSEVKEGQLRVWHSIYYRRDTFRVIYAHPTEGYVRIQYIDDGEVQPFTTLAITKHSSLIIDMEEELEQL